MTAEELLTDYFKITSLKELEKLLVNLQSEFIEKNILKEHVSENSVNELLDLIQKKESLPDIVNISFETIPGKTKYTLSCDTYHGGGVFKREGDRSRA